MAKPVGLNRRKNSTNYYLRIIIGEALSGFYGGKTRVNVSLETSDLKEACIRGHALRAQWEADLAAKRLQLSPQALPVVSPEMALTLASGVRHRVLAGDEALRADPHFTWDINRVMQDLKRPGKGLMIGDWSPPPPPPPRSPGDLSGMPLDELKSLSELNAYLDGTVAIDLARGNLAKVLPLVQDEARSLGFAFDPSSPGASEALRECLRAYRQAFHDVTLRDRGEVIKTPQKPTKVPEVSPQSRTLRAVYEKWQLSGEKPKSKDAITSMGLALRQFESQYPGLTVDQITREMGDSYRGWLRQNCNTPKTARDRLDRLKTLLKYAAEVLEWLPRQPWRSLSIQAETTNKRRPWEAQELQALFGAPLFTRYELPTLRDRQHGRDGAYWVPLLGLYTGARPGELCQLQVQDIKTVDGIPCIHITDDGEGQKVKTKAGRRLVPIHSELIRLGFLDYAQAIKDKGASSLWPQMHLRTDKPSDYFGRWFLILRRSVGLMESRPDFYCFRHTVRPLMRRAGIDSGTMDKITGHETRGSIGDTVYDHRQLEELKTAIETIHYPGLVLPVVAPEASQNRG